MHIYVCKREKNAESEGLVREFLVNYARDTGLSLNRELTDNPAILRTEKGKPYFADPALSAIHFSVSHSGRYWACAFERFPIGFDMEDRSKSLHSANRNQPASRYEAVAKRFFTPEEYEEVLAGGEEVFFHFWIRKEAYVKYKGDSLLSEFSRPSGFAGAFCEDIPILPHVTGAWCADRKITNIILKIQE